MFFYTPFIVIAFTFFLQFSVPYCNGERGIGSVSSQLFSSRIGSDRYSCFLTDRRLSMSFLTVSLFNSNGL